VEFLKHMALVVGVLCLLVDGAVFVEGTPTSFIGCGLRSGGGRSRLDLELLIHEVSGHTSCVP
jgi:hypothetical protein